MTAYLETYTGSLSLLDRMRQDWDRRAEEDAERFVYTRDSAADVHDFVESGRANYNQLLRPFLPILLDGRPASDCRAVEIGCGAGRMTRWFAEAFGEVHAFDVSPRMIEAAQGRLSGCPNVHFHPSTGRDLAPLPDASVDLVFSYIVFQHIPSREVIENYVREAARVLRPDGAFKFQVNGSPAQPAQPDTWLGATFSYDQIRLMLEQAGFLLLGAEGAETQYFVLTAKKAPSVASYILPGEPSAASMLLTGWGATVDQSWRPVHAHAVARLPVPTGANRFFLGLYGWPGTDSRLTVRVDAVEIGGEPINGTGDVFLDWNCAPIGAAATVTLDFSSSCPQPPAVRCLGLYAKK